MTFRRDGLKLIAGSLNDSAPSMLTFAFVKTVDGNVPLKVVTSVSELLKPGKAPQTRPSTMHEDDFCTLWRLRYVGYFSVSCQTSIWRNFVRSFPFFNFAAGGKKRLGLPSLALRKSATGQTSQHQQVHESRWCFKHKLGAPDQ